MPDPFGGDFLDSLLKGPFGDGLNHSMKGQGPLSQPAPKKKEKGVPWSAKIIKGKYYVPLEQVVELLKQNEVLPAVRRGIEDRIALLEAQKDLDI